MLDSLVCASKIDSIKGEMSYNKTIITDFETEIYTALSYFPELDSTQIEFRYANIKTSLTAQPKIGSLFRRRSKRKYIIRIKPATRDSVAALSQAGFNGAVGGLGHELNHIIDYSKRGFFGILGRLFDYASKRGKRKFEAEIDRMTIQKGLGWQVYDWEDFVMNNSNAKVQYKAYKKRIYYSPEELKKLINQTDKNN